jgi:hypothetical protein
MENPTSPIDTQKRRREITEILVEIERGQVGLPSALCGPQYREAYLELHDVLKRLDEVLDSQ